jgi:hypothetical protein
MTISESILAYIAAQLLGVSDATVFRSRQAALARVEGTGIIVHPETETVVLRSEAADVVLRELTVLITVLARGDVPDQVADPIEDSIHSIIMSDRTLGGRTLRIYEESRKWTLEEADQIAVAVEMRYRMKYATPASSLSAGA